MIQYYDKILKGTEREDGLVILQYFKGMIGQCFSFLNYYKEIPVSYDATLVSVENEMAEFEIHEYQAKAISIERKVLISSHKKSSFKEDIVAEVFYVSVAKKRVILRKFGYGKIHSEMRRFVRVVLDSPVAAEFFLEKETVMAFVKDISLGGAALNVASTDLLAVDSETNILFRLPDISNNSVKEVALKAKILKIIGEAAPFTCLVNFIPEKNSQQQISYYINQRQVEIIKELKELVV